MLNPIIIVFNQTQTIMMHCVFCETKNEFKSTFSPILLSERIMGIDYTDNILDHENPL